MEGEKLELDCMLQLFQNRLGEELLIQLLGLVKCFNPVPLPIEKSQHVGMLANLLGIFVGVEQHI
jgi:hypothetical protein